MPPTVSDQLRATIRRQFPALSGPTVFLENAGGSQVPAVVVDRIRDYMLTSYVQLGAGYELSRRATKLVDEAHDFVRMLMNGTGGEVILGPSTSAWSGSAWSTTTPPTRSSGSSRSSTGRWADRQVPSPRGDA